MEAWRKGTTLLNDAHEQPEGALPGPPGAPPVPAALPVSGPPDAAGRPHPPPDGDPEPGPESGSGPDAEARRRTPAHATAGAAAPVGSARSARPAAQASSPAPAHAGGRACARPAGRSGGAPAREPHEVRPPGADTGVGLSTGTGPGTDPGASTGTGTGTVAAAATRAAFGTRTGIVSGTATALSTGPGTGTATVTGTVAAGGIGGDAGSGTEHGSDLDAAAVAARRGLLGASPATDAIGSVLDLPVTGDSVVQALTPGFCDAASVYLLERWVLDAGTHSESEAPAHIEARRLSLRMGSGPDSPHPPTAATAPAPALRPAGGTGSSGPEDGTAGAAGTGAAGTEISGPDDGGRAGDGGLGAGVLPVGEVLVFPRHTPYARALATGRTQVLDAVDRHTSDRLAASGPDDERIRELLRSTSFMVVPLCLHGAAIGFVACTRGPRLPRFAPEDVTAVESLAARAAVALDNARRYEYERRTALAIRHSLLPPTGKAFAGCRVAHAYSPAGPGGVIGGDWYDVLRRPGGRVGLIVGDAMGHGPEAAVAMIQLRTAARTLAGLDTDPRDLLRGLDALAADTPGASFATCMYAEWDAAMGTCTVVGAGHPPPLLRMAGRRSGRVPITPGLPLGIGSWNGTATVLKISRPTLLLLYSDGLVEARHADIDDGIERLARALDDGAAGLPSPGATAGSDDRGDDPSDDGDGGDGPDGECGSDGRASDEDGESGPAQAALQALCDGLLHTAVPGGTADDRTLLLARLTPAATS